MGEWLDVLLVCGLLGILGVLLKSGYLEKLTVDKQMLTMKDK